MATRNRSSRNGSSPTVASVTGARSRIGVRKTYKLYIGGAFPRSESGRSYLVTGSDGDTAGQRRPRVAQGPARRRPRGAQARIRAGPRRRP